MLTPRAQQPEVSQQQYAVVLVNEDQLSQLMRRPAMRQVNSRFATQDVYARYQNLKRRLAAAAIVIAALVSGGLIWMFAPEPAMASMFPWSRPTAAPTLFTGASFSLTVASTDSSAGAGAAAARVRGLGLPAFTRRSPGKHQAFQALVGPFASLDEAEVVQRRLGGMGYRNARIFVDESLRGTAQGERATGAASTNPGVLLLGAPERVSLVLELESEPRQVQSTRPDGATLVIDAGPMATPAQPQQWSAPDGVHLLHTVAIETVSAQGGLHYVRARVALPEFAKANVRTEGRRVYVDLTWPLEEEEAARAPGRPAAPQRAAGEEHREPIAPRREAAGGGAYREAIDPIHQRITEVKPFLISAAQSGSTDVYAALDQTLATLEASLAAMSVPQPELGQHQLLVAATREARRGLEPGFAGDRLAHAQKAIAMFDGAMATPLTPTAQ